MFFRKKEIDTELNVPVHIGIIMDGNGRWAKKRGLPRKMGHREGAKTFRAITRSCKKLGVKYVTYYAFSTENWARPKEEVDGIMDLFDKYLDEVNDFKDENIRIRFIGDRSKLKPSLQNKMLNVEETSRKYSSMDCVLAINYGGRDEICHAVKNIAEMVEFGAIKPKDINEKIITENLYTQDIPPVDLIIRPSGEQRLSNFLIWQAAYSEYYFTNILWPDFKERDLKNAILAYSDRNRRFGVVVEKK